jgi:hypothetical protein
MSKISRSSQRNTFQKEKYIERCEENDKEPSQAYLEMFDNIDFDKLSREEDPNWRKDNMEYDLRSTDWILEKVRESDVYAQNLYASMCNREFIKHDVMSILKNQRWSCSWRYAGGIVADMQEKGDYIDWYCSGIRDTRTLSASEFAVLTEQEQLAYKEGEGYVGEGFVTDEIREDLFRLGWVVQDDEMDD